MAFEVLDNGVLSSADPARMQRLADNQTAARIDALLCKWLARLPDSFATADRAAGIRYDVSVLQAEFALTQVFDRPVQGGCCSRRSCARTSTCAGCGRGD
ncbi:MAG: hypothetical protein OXH52_10645 [Gammaproteobacteria bacterium]|nr:hypothetical protein [Gammaproteobacteria bacterium]